MKAAKRFLSMLLTLCMLLSLLPSTVFAANSNVPFTDVKETDWFYDAVGYVYENGMMSGTGNNQFSPNVTTTRGMIVTILYRLEGSPAVSTASFDDVAAGEYYANGVSWAAANGVVSGYGNNLFGPNDPITREQMAAILYRYTQHKEYETTVTGDVSSFTDGASVSSYAVEPMNWAVSAGLFSGVGSNMLNPTGNTTRAQVATILMRFCDLLGITPIETYTVTFDYNYGDKGTYKTVTVKAGDVAAQPAAPTRSGYSFCGWYTKATGGEKYDFDTTVTADLTLYAHWSKSTTAEPGTDDPENQIYTVTFEANGGSAVEPQSVEYGKTVAYPENPTKDDCILAGWYLDKNETDWTNFFDFSTAITRDLTLYAIWVDVNTDSDSDGLVDDLEIYISTDPRDADTDNDELNDYLEAVVMNYDPLHTDSDANGTADGDEDYDEDGLTNLQELSGGTDPIVRDSDHDGLTDQEELVAYHTDPNVVDTDGDGASDGDEVRLSTDPLAAQTSFVETISTGNLTESLPVTLEVKVRVNGNQVGTLEITPVTSASNPLLSPATAGYLGVGYDITVEGQPTSAELTFHYDTELGTIGEDFQPRVYYFNEAAKTFEELPNQTVTEGSVSVTVNHFSTYILLNKVDFDAVWEVEIKPPQYDETIKGLDVVFVIDSSGSMTTNDRNNLRLQAAKNFVDKLGETDRAAVIEFDSYATLYQAFTSDHSLLDAAIDRVDASGNTNLREGMGLAIKQFTEAYTRTDAYKYIIFLTDGNGTYSTSYTTWAKENEIVVYTIGLGSGVKEATLKGIADGTGGKYYFASDADALENIYKEIAVETVDYTTDTNADGISDYYTELIKTGDLPLSNGSLEFMGVDFNYNEAGEPSDDYDGDGVINGDELNVQLLGSRVYMYKISDPMMVHSDSDGLDDQAEHLAGSDPMVNSYIDSAVDYPWNDSNFTYVDVYHEEDSWLNEGARQIWSSITFNWSHQDEAKSVLASFFDTYSNTDQIRDTADAVALEVGNLLGEDMIGRLEQYYKAGTLSLDGFKNSVKAIKNWIAAGNSARNLSPDRITQLKAQLGLFEYKYTFRGISKADKIGMGISFAIDEAFDIYNVITAYSAITATQVAFQESQDVLEWIKNHDNAKEKYVTKAAEDILLVVNGKFNDFKEEQAKDLALATTENAAALTLNILSAANPYVMAINLAIGLLDMITPTTEIAEATYCLYVIDELVLANKNLFQYEAKTEDYYDITEADTRYIELLIGARIWGGEFAKNITGKQIYLGADDDEVREVYEYLINSENDTLRYYLNMFTT